MSGKAGGGQTFCQGLYVSLGIRYDTVSVEKHSCGRKAETMSSGYGGYGGYGGYERVRGVRNNGLVDAKREPSLRELASS